MVNSNKMNSVKDQYKTLHLSTTKYNTGTYLTYSLGRFDLAADAVHEKRVRSYH